MHFFVIIPLNFNNQSLSSWINFCVVPFHNKQNTYIKNIRHKVPFWDQSVIVISWSALISNLTTVMRDRKIWLKLLQRFFFVCQTFFCVFNRYFFLKLFLTFQSRSHFNCFQRWSLFALPHVTFKTLKTFKRWKQNFKFPRFITKTVFD